MILQLLSYLPWFILFIIFFSYVGSRHKQAEGLMSEIRAKERELERLTGLRRRMDDVSAAARNGIARKSSASSGSMDYLVGGASRRQGTYAGGKTDGQQRLMLMRFARQENCARDRAPSTATYRKLPKSGRIQCRERKSNWERRIEDGRV